MKKINPYKNALLRIKRWIKEDVASFKNKFKNNPLIKKIAENKKTSLIISGTIIVVIILIIIISNVTKSNMNYNNSLKGPNVKNLVLMKNSDLEMRYSGNISNGFIQGAGVLQFKTDKYEITLDGTFDEITDPSEAAIQIGSFLNGYITVYDTINKVEYNWNGTFENFKLKTGSIRIKKEEGYILYDGSFIDNKLNGIGIKKIYKDGMTQTITGWFENGVYQEAENSEEKEQIKEQEQTTINSSNKNENENNTTVENNSTVNSDIVDFEDTFTTEEAIDSETKTEIIEDEQELETIESSEIIEPSEPVIEAEPVEESQTQTTIEFVEPEL